MDCLAGHSVSRVPSIHQLALLYLTHSRDTQSVPMTGIRQDKIYYVVNPDQDLPKTQAALEPTLQSMNIKDGVAGEQPSGTEVKRALSSMDAFMYCGNTQCGNFLIFLSLRFYVKSNFRILEVQKLLF